MEAIVYKDKMWPINAASKAKRIAWGRPQNAVSWAFMKMLRETCKCMSVYEENPYTEVYQFTPNLYGLLNPNCDGLADVWQYLIVGPSKAMLIDTGFGLGDVPGLCAKLSGGRELIVVCTHEGPDHCLGNFRFDKVYCYEGEVDAINAKCVPGCFDYLFDKEGNNIWLEFDREDLPEYREYELIGVPNNTVFNLGEDYDIELIWTGGHSGGHAAYLDKKSRMLFAGDVVSSDMAICGQGNHPELADHIYRNIETLRNNIAILCGRMEEYDYIFPGHQMVYLENRVMPDILQTLEAILKDPDGYDFAMKNGLRNKLINGLGSIAYKPEGVYVPK